MPGALAEVEDADVMGIIRACINHDPTQRPSAAELLSLPFYAEADAEAAEQRQTEIKVEGSLRDTAPGDPKVVHLLVSRPTRPRHEPRRPSCRLRNRAVWCLARAGLV